MALSISSVDLEFLPTAFPINADKAYPTPEKCPNATESFFVIFFMKGCNIAGDNTITNPKAIAPVNTNWKPVIPAEAKITAIIQARYNETHQ